MVYLREGVVAGRHGVRLVPIDHARRADFTVSSEGGGRGAVAGFKSQDPRRRIIQPAQPERGTTLGGRKRDGEPRRKDQKGLECLWAGGLWLGDASVAGTVRVPYRTLLYFSNSCWSRVTLRYLKVPGSIP